MINGRYQLHHKIGMGGMGIVYLATDRLKNEQIALKQIKLPTQSSHLPPESFENFEKDLRIALAHEFQTIATLRHPYIISVLNYGFDHNGSPFFTMPYLAEAKTFLEVAPSLSVEQKLSLIYKLIQAVAYLHRRGIVHRDLKPHNILLTPTAFKVLDFGLSTSNSRKQISSSAGTPRYLAPEIWYEQDCSYASDMFAIGVLAFQLLATEQAHPFAPIDHMFVDRLLEQEPDWSLINCQTQIKFLLSRLLAKDPTHRLSATTALHDLSKIVSHEELETQEIRESYLQSAIFVGREKEKKQLNHALQQIKLGHGSAVLIGGESGVGKSRLLNEIRIEALVNQVMVVHGRAIQGRGSPYQIWHETLRPLLLSATYRTVSMDMLNQLIPETEKMLEGLPVVKNKIIENPSLLQGVIELICAQPQPVLLLLEDLHWANASLGLLYSLSNIVHEYPLLILGTYRQDETPHLPDSLPHMLPLKLNRLSHKETEELSQAILGQHVSANLMTLLLNETEGNTFFLVETIRALAQQAGNLSDVQTMKLPETLLTGGVRSVLRRRIEHIAPKQQALLRVAAVAGRNIDFRLLASMTPDLDASGWSQVIMSSGLFDVIDDQWLFAHDKLRQMLIDQLSPSETENIHAQIAQAYEVTYAKNPIYALRIVRHWQQANQIIKAWENALSATQYLLQISAFVETKQLIHQLLTALPTVPTSLTKIKMQLLYELSRVDLQIGNTSEAIKNGEQGLKIAQSTNDLLAQSSGHIALGRILANRDIDQAEHHLQSGLQFARQAGDVDIVANSLWSLCTFYRHIDFAKARAYYQRALLMNQVNNNLVGVARTLNGLGLLAITQGNFELARNYHQKSLALSREIGNRVNVVTNLNNLGLIERHQKRYQIASEYHTESLDISYQITYIYGVSANLNNLGLVAFASGDFAQATKLLYKALEIRRDLNDTRGVISTLSHIARLLILQKKLGEAQVMLSEGLEMALVYHMPLYILHMFASILMFFGEIGEVPRATHLCGLIQVHPLASQEIRDIASAYHLELQDKQTILLWEQYMSEGEWMDAQVLGHEILHMLHKDVLV